MRNWHQILFLICGLLMIAGGALAEKPGLGVIQPGEYPLQPITNHTPGAFQNYDAYWESLQKVDLEIGKAQQFKDLPKLAMKEPFTGTVVLGNKPQKFGVIIDIAGEEKRLYLDSDGDGSFAGETWVPLLNEWYGLQIYWVYGPEPVRLKVAYQDNAGQSHPIEIEVSGLLNKPGAIVKEKPYLKAKVRTWFMGKIMEDGVAKLVALVDRNNNGQYNDAEDLLFIDYNDDGKFQATEALPHKKGVALTAGKQKLTADWTVYPDKLVIGGKK